jgi:MoCo/4Fe-4S cofactor protein with predicted Tat translocation signal
VKPLAGRQYWRSLDELSGSPEFRALLEREFPGLSAELLSSPTRRQFLKVMGASLALAGLTGCRWPKENIVPHTERPAGRLPGVPVHYATTFEVAGIGAGLVVKSFDGRPIKIEGNARHPFSLGAASAWAQASLLEMYDPDRSTRPVHRGAAAEPASAGHGEHGGAADGFEAFALRHFAELRSAQGAGLCVLAEASRSPTLAALRGSLMKICPQARWYEYEPVSRDHEREGTRVAFGVPLRPHHRLDQTDVLLCLDADPLLTHPASLRYTRDFANRRTAENVERTMLRLYAVESGLSLTGGNADRRFAVRSSEMGRVIWRLAAELARLGATVPVKAEAGGLGRDAFVAEIAEDLWAHKGRGAIMVGPGQPPEVHAVAHLLNLALGNVGGPVAYTVEPDADRPSHADGLAELTARMNSGQVSTLLILGGNPVYTAPADLNFVEALAKTPTSVHLSLFYDETSRHCTWHVPRAHYLEAWGDALAYDGTLSLVQPLIEPLYQGRTPIDLLALVLDDHPGRSYDLVRQTFESTLPGTADAQAAWTQALHDGFVAGTAWPLHRPSMSSTTWDVLIDRLGKGESRDGGIELVFAPDVKVFDGRWANNGWLQELPDPLTKLTWDNAALLAPVTADKLGVKRNGDLLRIEAGGRALEIAAFVMPGHAADSITLPLGYGRGEAAGQVAAGTGFDAYRLRTRAHGWVVSGAKVERVGRRYPLATTQDHHAMRTRVAEEEMQSRLPALVRDGTLASYRAYLDRPERPADPRANFAYEMSHHKVHLLPLVQLFQPRVFPDSAAWAMAIDLSRCTGCSACVVACQAENNVPVVGKDEVGRGREMLWLRVDRYFQGEPDAPGMIFQPVPCQHCENAPCEQVCPVAATTHDSDGLNVMVYNRCIGTRYCSNNCPFKVRRFNWFYNHHGPYHPRSVEDGTVGFPTWKQPGMLPQKRLTEIEMLAMNPEVTVRSRGVMEKCTFCVQRIAAARIPARNAEVSPRATAGDVADIPDGTIVPACAQTCPADAIVFGDLHRADSRVRKLHEHHRAYVMLEELNVRPRVKYLVKLRNPGGAEHDAAHGAPARAG